MSPTPILDRQHPVPLPPPVNLEVARWIVPVIGAALLFLPLELFPRDRVAPFDRLACLVPAYCCCLVLHELGHIAAGLLVGFEFRQLVLGPWMFTREAKGFQLRFLGRRFAPGGYTLMRPRSPDFLRRKCFVITAGGPLATLLVFVAILFLPWGPFAFSSILVNLWAASLTWIPAEQQGHYTDAKIIQILLRKGPAADRLAAILYLMAMEGAGVRPRCWPLDVVANLSAEGGGQAYCVNCRMYLLTYARAIGTGAEIASALEQVLSLSGEMTGTQRLAAFTQAAILQATTRRNATLAREWLDDARSCKFAVAPKGWDAAALAAVASAENDQPDLHENLLRAWTRVHQAGGDRSRAARREFHVARVVFATGRFKHPPTAQ